MASGPARRLRQARRVEDAEVTPEDAEREQAEAMPEDAERQPQVQAERRLAQDAEQVLRAAAEVAVRHRPVPTCPSPAA